MHGIYVKIQNIVLIPIIEEMSHCFKFPSRKWDLSSVALQNKSVFFRLLYNARARTHTHTHTVWLLWTSDQLIAQAYTYTTNTRKDHPCPQRDLNPQSQISSGLRPHSRRCAVFLSTRPVQPIARRQHFARKTECVTRGTVWNEKTSFNPFTGYAEKERRSDSISFRENYERKLKIYTKL